ncbi:hypothetical protein [Bradyrhizobium aeschynomenes]|uniref:hypothetical protein n=1 Tax=Bradyrhizobium aeschynomenes TaxID=2734909 RepID=UPI0035D61259
MFERSDDQRPSYMMWLGWRAGKIGFIRDYRYVGHVVADAELVLGCTSETGTGGRS